jgi:hypothetical protein
MYMGEKALVRYFFQMGPTASERGRWWPDLGYKYLRALLRGFPVRAMPLGWAHFQILDDPRWKRWKKVRGCFGCEMVERPVNVICCPAGIQMGRTVTRGDFAPPQVEGVPGFLTASGNSDLEEIVYQPDFALSACWTADLRNIAITGTNPTWPNPQEVAALKRYDAVVTPTHSEGDNLREVGVNAQCYTPRQMADDAFNLGLLLRGKGDE